MQHGQRLFARFRHEKDFDLHLKLAPPRFSHTEGRAIDIWCECVCTYFVSAEHRYRGVGTARA